MKNGFKVFIVNRIVFNLLYSNFELSMNRLSLMPSISFWFRFEGRYSFDLKQIKIVLYYFNGWVIYLLSPSFDGISRFKYGIEMMRKVLFIRELYIYLSNYWWYIMYLDWNKLLLFQCDIWVWKYSVYWNRILFFVAVIFVIILWYFLLACFFLHLGIIMNWTIYDHNWPIEKGTKSDPKFSYVVEKTFIL